MNDTVETVAETVAPKVKAVITYEAVSSRDVELVPLDGEKGVPNRTVTMAFCAKTNTKGAEVKVVGAWRGQISYVFDGATETVVGYGAKPKAALEAVLKALPGSSTYDDFESVDFESDAEFWGQKLDVPAAPLVDYASTVSIDGVQTQLGELRATLEATLEDVASNEEGALEGRVVVGRAIAAVHAAKGNKFEVTEAFLRGDGAGDNAAKMPKLAKLGKGVNAIKEAMRFGQAHQKLLDVTPASINSGKGLERLKSVVTRDMVAAAAGVYKMRVEKLAEAEGVDAVYLPTVYENGVGDKAVNLNGFDAASASLFLRSLLYAKHGFDISNAFDLSVDELQDAVDARSDAYSAEFLSIGGKHFNSYVAEDFDKIKKAFGMALHAHSGSELPNAHGVAMALVNIVALNEAESGTDAEKIASLTKALHGVRANPLIGQGAEEVRKLLAGDVREAERREVLSETEDNLVNEKVRKQFGDLTVTQKAAKLFAMISKFDDCSDVIRELAAMDRQHKKERGDAGGDEVVSDAA